MFENRPALYFCNYKENDTRMLSTLFIDDFVDIMEQYSHYYNHNWQYKKLNTTEETKHNGRKLTQQKKQKKQKK